MALINNSVYPEVDIEDNVPKNLYEGPGILPPLALDDVTRLKRRRWSMKYSYYVTDEEPIPLPTLHHPENITAKRFSLVTHLDPIRENRRSSQYAVGKCDVAKRKMFAKEIFTLREKISHHIHPFSLPSKK